MSIEDDFRAALVAHAPLAAAVNGVIAKHAAPKGSLLPVIVYSAEHELQQTLLGDSGSDRCIFSVECWAAGAVQADAVADLVEAAIEAHQATATDAVVTVLSRGSAYDGDVEEDGIILSVEWWV